MDRWHKIGMLLKVSLVLICVTVFFLGCEKSPTPVPVKRTQRVKKQVPPSPPPQKAAPPEKRTVLSYDPKGLVDPFKPFIQIGSNQGPIQGVPRTPLQEYGLSQLSLTAIIWMGKNDSRAMVRDSAGKGFTLKRGTYIGKRGGKVKAILMDRVIIEEPVGLYADNSNTREVVLKMQGEGGKE
jgi:Tfp pilus assembly protein PilP